MKKIISVLICMIAAFSVCAAFAVPAMAETVNSPEGVEIVSEEETTSSDTSPETGVSIAAATVCAACAGAAILALSKKKDAE